MKLIADSLETYIDSARLILPFSFLVLAVTLFMLGFFTYVVAGAGFVRYADVFTGVIGPLDYAFFFVVGLLGLFAMAFLSTAVTLTVKLRRTMDDIGFRKLMVRFPRYLYRIMAAWVMLGAATVLMGLLFTFLRLPTWLIALAELGLWAFFIYIPQSIILHDKRFGEALEESAKYCIKKPLAVATYYVFMLVLLFLMILVDVFFGQFYLFWLAALFDAFILFMFIIPYLEIVKANIFITRYRLALSGLK